jgi:hypothetical protein
MSTLDDEHRKVRQRARFKCEECREVSDNQYAHIIPDSVGGPANEQNLVFLCYPCHKKLDYSILRKHSPAAEEYLRKLRDAGRKSDGWISDRLMFFTNSDVVVKIGNGFTFINCEPILFDLKEQALLSVGNSDGKLDVTGKFFDENSRLLLEIEHSKFRCHGNMIWDLELKNNGEINLISENQEIQLSIKQEKQGDALIVSGRLYANGIMFIADGDGVMSVDGGFVANNNTIMNGPGLRLGYDGKNFTFRI